MPEPLINDTKLARLDQDGFNLDIPSYKTT